MSDGVEEGDLKGEPTIRAGPVEEVASMEQLPLPLDVKSDPTPAPLSAKKRPRRKTRGFVPVTRDPDVAQSYSDNAALDNAIAQGLAQLLVGLPPEELAALRARVARAARRNGKTSSPDEQQ